MLRILSWLPIALQMQPKHVPRPPRPFMIWSLNVSSSVFLHLSPCSSALFDPSLAATCAFTPPCLCLCCPLHLGRFSSHTHLLPIYWAFKPSLNGASPSLVLRAKVNISPSSPFSCMCRLFPFGDGDILDGLPDQTRNSPRSNPRVEPSLCLTGGQDTELE